MLEDRITKLMDYGLTPLEAKIYIFLVQFGKLSAGELARTMHIARPEAYRLVRELAKKGIVVEQLGRPMLFEALDPDKMLQQLTKQFEKKVEFLRCNQADLKDWLISRKSEQEERSLPEQFKMLREQLVFEKVSEMILSAKEEILFSCKSLDASKGFQNSLDSDCFKAVKKEIRVRGVMEIGKDDLDVLPTLEKLENAGSGIEIRHGLVDFRYILKDKKELLIGTGSPADISGLWTNDPNLIQSTTDSFEQRWKASKPLRERVSEVEAGVSEADLDRYRSFVEKFHGIAYRADLNFKAIFMHGAVEEITGYNADEFLNKIRWSQIVHPDDLHKDLQQTEMLSLTPRYSNELEYRIIRQDGEVRWVTEALQSICDVSGKPILIQGSLYDITERKKMEEALKTSEAKIANILTSSPYAITVTDVEGKIVECNEATLKLHDFSSKDEVIGPSAFTLIAEKDRERAAVNLKKTLEQGVVRDIEYTLTTKDGREFPAEFSAGILRDASGNTTGFVAITKDITERKNMEEQLRRSEQRLNDTYDDANEGTLVMRARAVKAWGMNLEEILTTSPSGTESDTLARQTRKKTKSEHRS